MSIIGLINAHGQNVRFEDIIPTYRFEDWEIPLPALVSYSRKKSVYKGTGLFASATQLLQPTRIFWMERQLESFEDPNNVLAAHLGTRMHGLFEDGGNALLSRGWFQERSFFVEIQGVRVGFMPDTVDPSDGTLYDYKISKAWKMKKALDASAWKEGGSCHDWTMQLSLYRWGLAQAKKTRIDWPEGEGVGTPVLSPWNEPVPLRRALLYFIAKDWNKHQHSFPQHKTFPVPLLSLEETEAWLRNRIDHLRTYAEETDSDRFPDCSDNEVWLSEYQWNVTRSGNEKASAWVKSKDFSSGDREVTERTLTLSRRLKFDDETDTLRIEYTPPIPKRCANFCHLKSICGQVQRKWPQVFQSDEASSDTEKLGS